MHGRERIGLMLEYLSAALDQRNDSCACAAEALKQFWYRANNKRSPRLLISLVAEPLGIRAYLAAHARDAQWSFLEREVWLMSSKWNARSVTSVLHYLCGARDAFKSEFARTLRDLH